MSSRMRKPNLALELKILTQLAAGLNHEETAQNVYVSRDVVNVHLAAFKRRHGLTNSVHAVAYALRKGMIE